MPDRWAVALAAATFAGALRPTATPVLAGALVAVAAVALRRPLLLCAGVAVLASALGQRAIDGLEGVVPQDVTGEITLLTDPAPSAGGVRAEARLGPRRVELRATGSTAATLADALAGERFRVRAALGPPPAGDWAVARHLGGRLQVHRAEPAGPAAAVPAAANALRRALARGAEALPEDQRALFTGLVVGDDRAQSAALADSFRGAGLTHLLAVSGQNVAFVLSLGGPVLRRLRIWPRLLATLALVAGFVVLTRAEPSVVRAAAMAAAAAATLAVGRPLPRLRVLSLAVVALVLVDPLLVRSLGFRLSLAATAAIVVLAAPMAQRMALPRWLAEPLAVTLAAQVGVAPFLVTTFGPLPLASVPANLLVVPAAGVVMAWGMSAGLVAGGIEVLAPVVHLPTSALLWWIELVADRAAAAPLGQLGLSGVTVLAGGVGLVLGARHRRALARVGAVLVAGVVLLAVAVAHAPPPLRRALAPGIVRWHGPGTDVVVLGGGGWRSGPSAGSALAALRGDGVGAIDLLVVADASVDAAAVSAVVDRHPPGAVLVPAGLDPGRRPPGSVPVGAATTVPVGGLLVLVVPGEARLVVEAWPLPP